MRHAEHRLSHSIETQSPCLLGLYLATHDAVSAFLLLAAHLGGLALSGLREAWLYSGAGGCTGLQRFCKASGAETPSIRVLGCFNKT